jgi:hypothetical protein
MMVNSPSRQDVDHRNNIQLDEILNMGVGHQDCGKNSRKRTSQYPNESSGYTPKRNRTEETIQQQSSTTQQGSSLGQNRQPSTETNTSTSTYFNTDRQRLDKQQNESSSNRKHRESPRESYPPFRITLKDTDKYPSTDLGIIRNVNLSCKMNLTYGRYTKSNEKQLCYLLYASTSAQFEKLMVEANWPDKICDSEYKVDLPTKIPTSYSIVVLDVPPQWNAQGFGEELKKRYSTIVRTERLYFKGGRPISKVRIDFSSYKELPQILKTKRILMDDDNMSYAIEPYTPPTRILRCFVCQKYDDHVAAHCPNKNDPICFKCGQHHAYDPNCPNTIQCAHCKGDHMAGSPNCPIKLEIRQEKNRQKLLKSTNWVSPPASQQQGNVWKDNSAHQLFGNPATTSTHSSMSAATSTNSSQIEIVNILNKINNTMVCISQQLLEMNDKFTALNTKTLDHDAEITHINYFINEILCPLVKEVTIQTNIQTKAKKRQIITPLYEKLLQYMMRINNNALGNASSTNEINQSQAISNDVSNQMSTDES